MNGGHDHALYWPRDTPLHRLAPQCKLLAVFCFVLIVVATPREQFWAFACYAGLLGGVAAVARVPPPVIGKRALIEVPFVAFAVLLPFISTGTEQVHVLGLALSESGLLGAFNIIAKGTLGVVAAILLGATTQIRDMLAGLERLHMPRLFVIIAGFMVRYVSLVTDDLGRMRIALESRGLRARSPAGQLKALAAAVGALFIRTYERGERVYVAMLSRGYTAGATQRLSDDSPSAAQWAGSAILPAAALVISIAARTQGATL